MALKCGIVGLPNVGKSTLFNALGSAKAEAANYPFCTIEPNIGVFNVPDKRLYEIAKLVLSEKIVPATVQIVDIAGIVRGASKGEGLGNKFLSHIREVDAIIHLVRCFLTSDVVHVEGSVDPARDIEVINTELILVDLETIEKRVDKDSRMAKVGDKEARKNFEIISGLKEHLNKGNLARTYPIDPIDIPRVTPLCLLTLKPVLYVANSSSLTCDETQIKVVEEWAKRENAQSLTLDCGLESQIAELPESEREEYMAGLGISEPGLHRFIRSAFSLMGLITYYTAGPKETRAWTILRGTKAPQAAGVIHSDFERGFICAQIYRSADLLKYGSEAKLREHGLLRQEGKDYVIEPDDVLHFKFNVTK